MASAATGLARVSTGVPGLDDILGGGLLQGHVYLLTGAPGTGKTILANHIAFTRAAAGDQAIYVTMLLESHGLLLEHLRTLAFFDSSVVGKRLNYLSGHQTLSVEGLHGFTSMWRRLVRERGARFAVIDSLASFRDFAETGLAYNRLLRELSNLASILGCTTVLIAPAMEPLSDAQTERVLADGIIELTRQTLGLRSLRVLEVVKQRGSRHLEGRHLFTIDGAGVTVWPRFESLPMLAEVDAGAGERLSFDVTGLDAMMRGGLVRGTSTAILGAPGAGKTTMGVSFLHAGARRGEQALYWGCFEPPHRLVTKAARLGLDLRDDLEAGRLVIEWSPATELQLDATVTRLAQLVEQRGVRRLFLDGLDGLTLATGLPERLSRALVALMHHMRARGVTTLISKSLDRIGTPLPLPPLEITTTLDNVVLLRYAESEGRTRRSLSILKSRESDHDDTTVPFALTAHGMRVGQGARAARAPSVTDAVGARAARRKSTRLARRKGR